MRLQDAAAVHALRSDLTEALGGGLLDPAATARRLEGVLGAEGQALFVHRDRKAALRWLRGSGLAPGRPLDPAALARPLPPRCVPLRAGVGGTGELLRWWCGVRSAAPDARGDGRAYDGPPRSSWQAWQGPGRAALAFHTDRGGLRVGVLLLEGLAEGMREALLGELPALTASVVRQYWLTWRARSKETLDAIARQHFPVDLRLPAAANQAEVLDRLARSADHLLAGVAAAVEAPVTMLAMPDTSRTHVGRIGQVGFVSGGRSRTLGAAERGLSLRFCTAPARVAEQRGTRAFHLADGAAMQEACRVFGIQGPGAPHGPVGRPEDQRVADRQAGFYPSDAALEPALVAGAAGVPDPLQGPWAYAAVPLDPRFWRADPDRTTGVGVPFEARRRYRLAPGGGHGVLKVQGRVRCALLDPPGAPPAPYGHHELRALDRWAPELGALLQRRMRQEEQALSDRLFEAAVSALVHGGPVRLVQLLQTFTQARCAALVQQAVGSDEAVLLASALERSVDTAGAEALSAALLDPDPRRGLGEAWLFESQAIIGELVGVGPSPVTFLKQPVTALGDRRLALVLVDAPAELGAGPGPQPFPGVLRPAIQRVARLLHATLQTRVPFERPAVGSSLPVADHAAFATAWRALQSRLAGHAPRDVQAQQGLDRFARDVAASFGQQGELARVLGVESQTVRRHMVAILPGAAPWRTLAREGDVTQVAALDLLSQSQAFPVLSRGLPGLTRPHWHPHRTHPPWPRVTRALQRSSRYSSRHPAVAASRCGSRSRSMSSGHSPTSARVSRYAAQASSPGSQTRTSAGTVQPGPSFQRTRPPCAKGTHRRVGVSQPAKDSTASTGACPSSHPSPPRLGTGGPATQGRKRTDPTATNPRAPRSSQRHPAGASSEPSAANQPAASGPATTPTQAASPPPVPATSPRPPTRTPSHSGGRARQIRHPSQTNTGQSRSPTASSPGRPHSASPRAAGRLLLSQA